MKRVLRPGLRWMPFAAMAALMWAANASAQDRSAAFATPVASVSAAQSVVSSVPKSGQWMAVPPVHPALRATTYPAATLAATSASASGAAISAAAPPVMAPASPESSQGVASTATTGVAAQPALAPRSSLAAFTPPGAATAAAPPGTQAMAPANAASAHLPTPGEIALRNATNQSVVRDPLSWSVTVYKSKHRLVVYYQGHFYKEYHAVFGRNLDPGTKVWAGDRRTPEGVYTIIAKRLNRRWRYFLKLNYPNDVDRQHYTELVSEGAVPRYHGRAISEGDGIGIHGTDEPILNTGNVNWTTGCISVDNDAIDELDALLPVGTLVIIKP